MPRHARLVSRVNAAHHEVPWKINVSYPEVAEISTKPFLVVIGERVALVVPAAITDIESAYKGDLLINQQ